MTKLSKVDAYIVSVKICRAWICGCMLGSHVVLSLLTAGCILWFLCDFLKIKIRSTGREYGGKWYWLIKSFSLSRATKSQWCLDLRPQTKYLKLFWGSFTLIKRDLERLILLTLLPWEVPKYIQQENCSSHQAQQIKQALLLSRALICW